VRIFLDEAVQHHLAQLLQADGHDATHVRLVEMQGASDEEVMAYAVSSGRIVVTTDTDFGALLALSGAAGPSVMLLRSVGDSLEERYSAITRALEVVSGDLLAGVVALVEPDRIRLRRLPIDDGA
jgi:predicted nuclease of predicted toxin-antitoxin system